MAKQEKTKHPSKKADIFKWALAVLLLVAGFVANYYFVAIPLPLRIVGWVLLSCVIFIIALQTYHGGIFWQFCKASRAEVRRVVWPNRQETFQTTLLVVVVAVIFALVMWAADSVLMWAVSWLTS